VQPTETVAAPSSSPVGAAQMIGRTCLSLLEPTWWSDRRAEVMSARGPDMIPTSRDDSHIAGRKTTEGRLGLLEPTWWSAKAMGKMPMVRFGWAAGG
jgi:hypothetical protein